MSKHAEDDDLVAILASMVHAAHGTGLYDYLSSWEDDLEKALALARERARGLPVIVHEIAVDGLPDMDALTGRVAFLFDGCIVSGWPLTFGTSRTIDDLAWEANGDVGRHGTFQGVTHWIEFPEPLHVIERGSSR